MDQVSSIMIHSGTYRSSIRSMAQGPPLGSPLLPPTNKVVPVTVTKEKGKMKHNTLPLRHVLPRSLQRRTTNRTAVDNQVLAVGAKKGKKEPRGMGGAREKTESKAVGAARSQTRQDGRRVIRHGMRLSHTRPAETGAASAQPNRVSRIYQGGQPKDEGPSAWSRLSRTVMRQYFLFLEWNQINPRQMVKAT